MLSEDLHRVAYNAAFEHFEVRCNGEGSFAEWQVTVPACCINAFKPNVRCAHNVAMRTMPIVSPSDRQCRCRSVEFYDKLQNTVGGGKPKMRWYFGEHSRQPHHVLGHLIGSLECSGLASLERGGPA